jgi:hypothetical protein
MKSHIYIVLITLFSISAYSQDLTEIKSKKPFEYSGSIDLRGISYTAKGIDPRRNPYTFVITGAPVLSFYGFTVPVSFSYSPQGATFNQPFNQIGLSPKYKWITLHGGYRNVSFSPYTLAGHTLLGGGFELTPGKFNLGFMTGRLNRSTTIDTLSGYVRPESFSRYGTAIKLGYGTQDKMINLSFLSAKDSEKGFKGNLDSTTVNQAANTVLGGDFKYSFFNKLSIYGDGAISIYTKNIHSDLEIDLDSSRKGLKTIKNLVDLNATSEYFLAYSGGIGYVEKLFSIKATYRKVEPNFQSMGAYFFQNDLQQITINPGLVLLQGKLRFNGSLGLQKDNLKNRKLAQTKRVISMANLNWDINTKFGLDANYTNFTMNSEPTVAMVDNKFLLAQTNENLSVTPRLVLSTSASTQIFILSYNGSRLKDLSEETSDENDIFSSVAMLNYTLTLNPSNLSINAGVNYVNNKMSVGNISNQGISLGASKGLLKNKILISTQNSYTRSQLMNGDGTIMNFSINGSYAPLKAHRINLRASSMSNSTKRENLEPMKYSELTAEIGYTFSF